MPAIQPGKWFEKVRCLQPKRRDDDKFALHAGQFETGDPAMLDEYMGGLARQHPHIDM